MDTRAYTARMKVIVVGAGRIGSAIAFHLGKAGHDIAVAARGERFDALSREGAIVTTDGQRAPVDVVRVLGPATPYDLAIVTVPEHQVASVLPGVMAGRAKRVVLMFNTFQSTERYRALLGAGRFAFGFPNMVAFLVEHRLRFRVDGPGMVTTMSCAELAARFEEAGMPSEVEGDMDAFLRSHVAMTVPLFLAALLTWRRASNLTWSEAKRLEVAWTDGFDVVRSLGHPLKPGNAALLARIPSWLRTGLLWLFARSKMVKDLGEFGPVETRWLIDAMVAAAPTRTRRLAALRP